MPLSKNESIIHEFAPQEFQPGTPPYAKQLFDRQNQGSHFRLSDQASIKAGIDQLQKKALDQKLEDLVLERLKDIQEKAYAEAYQIGQEEGQHQALEKMNREIEQRMQRLDNFLNTLESLKTNILNQNEVVFIRLIFEIAKRIAVLEIKQNKEVIVSLLHQLVSDLNKEDQIVIHISPTDLEFLESIRSTTAAELFSKIKFDSSPDITPGGCTIETAYWMTDATVEERIDRVWKNLESKLPLTDGATS